jgi:hypothetical protein
MKKIYKILISIICTIVLAAILGVVGLLIFMTYGGNACDQPPAMTCDCFCCDLFGSRGYEACGDLGLLLGLVIGVVVGVALMIFWIRKPTKTKKGKKR